MKIHYLNYYYLEEFFGDKTTAANVKILSPASKINM